MKKVKSSPVDLMPLDHPGVDNLIADITDSGQMFNAMSAYAGFDEMEPGHGVPKYDAVVHFAAVPRILINPDNETFRVNAMGTYNVIEAHEYVELFPGYFKNPEVRRRNAFCYIDARDLGQIVDLCLKKDGLGFQVFNAGNDNNSAIIPSKELAERFFPGTPFTREVGEREALFSNRKICEALGFKEQHNWQRYVKE